jgi:hypothetical protein
MLIAALLVACSTAAPVAPPTETPTPNIEASPLPSATPAATDTQAPQEPTQTAEPTQAAEPTLTPAPVPGSTAMLTPIKDPVNCRYGPNMVYAAIGVGLPFGKSTRITGKNGDGSFWQVMNPDGLGDVCWVSAVVVTTSGDLSSIPVAPNPTPFVTDVTVTADPLGDNTKGCTLPIDFRYTGYITVNGPLTVKWHWKSSKGTVSSDTKTMIFNSSGSYSFADTLSIPSTGYANVQLIVTSPNQITGEGDFKVLCH